MKIIRTPASASAKHSWALGLALLCLPAARAKDGSALDPAFAPVISRLGGFGSAVAVQADGKIVLAGGFNAINGQARNGLARLNPDGTVDPAFVTGAICCGLSFGGGTEMVAAISALALQPDGKIVIGGSFTNVNGVARGGLARLNADGSLDATFDPGSGLASTSPSGSLLPVSAIVRQPDGKMVVGGYFTAVNGVERSGLARLHPNGSVDVSFDPGSALAIGFPDFGPISRLAVLPSGQILVAGSFRAFANVKRSGLARLNADGSLDGNYDPATYVPEGAPSIDGLAVQEDGRIVISGTFTVIDDQSRSGLGRLLPDGKVDSSFDPVVDTAVFERYTVLGSQAGGRVVTYRQFSDPDGTPHRQIARLNSNGTLDASFRLELAPGEGSRLQVRDVAFQADGSVLVAGNLSLPDPGGGHGLVKVGTTGASDPAFRPQLELAEGLDGNVLGMAVQADGKVLLGGTFNRVNGAVRTQIARVNRDGSLDSSFAPVIQNDQASSVVSAVLVQSDGKVVLGGSFTSVNQVARGSIARLNADGSLDMSFDPGSGTQEGDPSGFGAAGRVTAMALQSDGKVLVAGDFASLNGQSGPYLARLNSDGTVDLSFSSGVGTCFLCDPPDIRQVELMSNGLIMVSGVFNRVDVFFINGVTRLQTNGSVDLALNPPVTTEEQVTAMAVGPDDKTTVAVSFPDPIGEEFRTRFLRFNLDGTVDAAFAPQVLTGQGRTSSPVTALRVDGQGRLLVAGWFASIGGARKYGLARLNTDGSLDASFDAGAGFGNGVFPPSRHIDRLISALALENDGGILVGGAFATADNQVRLGLARFRADSPGSSGDGLLRLSGLNRAANGVVSMLVSGQDSQRYRIEASADLRTWTALGTITGAATPQVFTDSSAGSFSWRFYRATGE